MGKKEAGGRLNNFKSGAPGPNPGMTQGQSSSCHHSTGGDFFGRWHSLWSSIQASSTSVLPSPLVIDINPDVPPGDLGGTGAVRQGCTVLWHVPSATNSSP